MNVKVLVLFVLVLCVHFSNQQQNRQSNQIHSLAYSESDFNPLPPVTRPTTTTEVPESTTKKKGFFSGFTGFFKSKDKDTTTTTIKPAPNVPTTVKSIKVTQSSTTTVKPTIQSSTSTVKSIAQSSTTTVKPVLPPSLPPVPPRSGPSANVPTVPPRSSSIPTVPPRSYSIPSSTTQAPAKKTTKDEFPPLPGVTSKPGQQPSIQQTGPSIPNAWGKPPGASNQGPPPAVSFFPQSPATTKKPQSSTQSSSASSGTSLASDAELLTLSESLFSKDIHNTFKYVTVNFQGRTQSSATSDEALQPLLAIDEKLYTMNTVEKMKLLYNNYEQDASINEYVTPNERKEENDFIDAVLATPVMRHAMNFLQQKGVVTPDPQTHRELLKTIWFNLYSRGMGKIGSSGFEHVFLSEVKNASAMGLHNWIYFSEAEKDGDLDYKGWTKKIDLGNKGQIAKVRFTLNGLSKPSNSLFIGTSPELELAIYTVCFEVRADQECRLAYGGKDFNIVTHSYRYRGKNLIGSAYPEI